MNPEDVEQLRSDYRRLARPEQLPPPGDWRYWIIVTGRGWGRNWTGCRWLAQRALEGQGPMLVVGNYENLRNRVIPEIIRVAGPPVVWKKTTRWQLTWPNGVVLQYAAGGSVDGVLRGGRWATVWAIDPLMWLKLDEMWLLVDGGAFLPNNGEHAQLLVTQSPPGIASCRSEMQRRVQWLRALMRRQDAVVVRGSTFDNPHLHPEFVKAISAQYAGTQLGRQELSDEIVEPVKRKKGVALDRAETRAQAFKESGEWTPAAIRRLAGSLKSGAVVPEKTLAEIGIVVLEDVSLATVREALEQQAKAREGKK